MNYQKGNYIYTEHGELPIKHISFDGYMVTGKDGRTLWANKIEPILLTEEWLIKFGFKRIKKGIGWDEFSYGKLTLVEVPTNKGKLIAFNYGSDRYNYLKYVHQLQQLYWCLTGEELTI
jgi:hypothetical protein